MPSVTEGIFSSNLVQRIELPDGTKYEFTYYSGYCEDCSAYSGLLKTLKLPSGETITFTYSIFTDALGSKNLWVNTVNMGGGTWTFAPATCGSNCNKTTVTRPSGDQTVYTFALDAGANGAWNTLTQNYTGSASSGTLALTVQNDYDTSLTNPVNGGSAFVRRTRTTTKWPGPSGDLVKKTEATYDTFTYNYRGTIYDGSRGNVLTSSEFAYGSGVAGDLVRQQVLTYLHDSIPSYITKNIVNRVTNAQTKDGAGIKKAETIISYDTTALTSVTGIMHHDDANFGTGFTLRGNPTVIQNWTGSSYLSTTLNYDTTGQVLSRSDPKGNVTQFSYTNDPEWYGIPPANAYVTQVTLPVSGPVGYRYYFNTGQVKKVIDQNGNPTNQTYDNLNRPLLTTLAGGGWANTQYTSATQLDFTGTLYGTTTGVSALALDTLGRPWEETLFSEYVDDGYSVTLQRTIVRRGYDTSGRLISVSNPWRTDQYGGPTYGVTSYQYDGLNRVKRTTLQDNNYTETFYGSGVGPAGGRTTQLCASGTYGLGYPTLSKDEAGKKRQVWVDALGRLVEADEPDATGALMLGTCYRYNVLGNLIQVDQGSQTRIMTYDALSRLTTETTPEAGTVNYFYTTVGGALCAGDPRALCRTTDARGITTTYAYDAENRLTGKTYSNGDPAISYFYDQTSYNGLTITNGKGRRTGMSDSSGQTAWSYHVNGWIVTERRTIAGVTKTISYIYNLNGSVANITYPSGLLVYHTYDWVGRLLTVSTQGNPCISSFAYGGTYTSHGALASVVLSAVNCNSQGIKVTNTYNKRLQPVNMKATHTNGTVTVLDQTYSFLAATINDGQVKSVTNNLTLGRSQSYTYDEMNRLATAQSQANAPDPNCWGQSYTYDRYANMPTVAVTKCSAPTLNLGISPTTNRITDSGFSYDAAGNLLTDGFGGTFTWNAESRMVTTAGVTYTYDGDNRRVKKSNGKLYWYGVQGEVLAESDLSGTILYEYIYFGGKRIARRTPSGTVHYYLADRLGSARVMVNSTGGIVEESDFLPYGTERVITDTLDNTYKFTGHERDTESGLDHTLHRQYASNLGRWHSPDPARGKAANPQSWNRYTYGNNPCNLVDRDGGILGPPPPEPPPPLPPGWIPVYGNNPPYYEEPTNSYTTEELAELALQARLTVTNFSNEGAKQERIRDVLKRIGAKLKPDSKCAKWLQGGAEAIQAMLDTNLFGHGDFSVNTTAAATGPVEGVPPGAAFTVNSNGAFFNATFQTGHRNYRGGTLRAQATILIHELAHTVGAAGFQSDLNNTMAGRANDKLVDQNCREFIEGLK